MVEIFKTNVQEILESKKIIEELLEHFPSYKINFDMEDCDRILRIEADFIEEENVYLILKYKGYRCQIFP